MTRRGWTGSRVIAAALLTSASLLGAFPAAGSAYRPSAATEPGVWTAGTPSGFKRQEVTYVTVGSRMFLAGGKSTRQQAFDPVTHTWSDIAPLPVALDHIQATELNGRVYYVGGLDGYPGNSYGGVNVYDPATNTVTPAAPLPAGRDRGAGGIVTYQGKIYVAGGFHTGGSVAWFDSYDPATNAWTSLPDIPERRDHTSAAVVAGKLYLIGGRTYGMGARPENDVYDFATGRWTTGLAPLPTLRAGGATVVFGAEVLVIGGERSGQGTFSTVEAYDTTTNTWRTMTSMPTARHGIQAAMFDGNAYIADGGTKMGGGGPTDVQEVLSLGTPPPPPLGKPDCRVRLLSESRLVGNNTYGTTGAGQTRSTTAAAGTTTTFVLSMQNDATVSDALSIQGPGGSPPFTVRYLAGLSGTTDITSAVAAGTYRTATLPAGGVRALRLVISSTPGASPGTSGTWLVRATSTTSPTMVDACAAQLTVG